MDGSVPNRSIDVSVGYSAETALQGMKVVGDVLAHYGVKGMKWGVRRADSGGGSSSSPAPAKTSRPASADVKNVDSHRETIKSGGTRALSNKELREVVERMNLDQQYAGLVGREPTKISRGHEAVKKSLTLAKTGQDIYNVVNSPAGKALRKALIGV